MGVDHSELKSIIRRNVQSFLVDISPIVSYAHCTLADAVLAQCHTPHADTEQDVSRPDGWGGIAS